MGVWRNKIGRRELKNMVLIVAIAILFIILMILIVFLIACKVIHEMAVSMDDSIRWGGRDSRDDK